MKGRDREFDQEAVTVRMQTWNLDAAAEDRALTGLEIMGQALAMTFAQLRRNDERGQFTTDRLAARVTEGPLGRGVPFLDDAARVHRNDAVESRLENRAVQFRESAGRKSGTRFIECHSAKSFRGSD